MQKGILAGSSRKRIKKSPIPIFGTGEVVAAPTTTASCYEIDKLIFCDGASDGFESSTSPKDSVKSHDITGLQRNVKATH